MIRLSLWLFVLILAGCTTPLKTSLQRIQVGMDKDVVLQKVGDPKRTFRSNSQDHWIYVFFEGEKEWRQQIDFRDGKVTQVGRAVSKEDWERELEETATMEEFEAKARALQQKKAQSKGR